jgi:thioester reductase-like protein
VLITGFPSSFLAVRVLRKVLATERCTVTAVVQEKFRARAEAIVAGLDADAQQRVCLLEGDVTAMDLGLSGKELRALTSDLEVIHHCAAITWLGADRKLAERVNVGGTREVVEVADAAGGRARVVHWSTALVSGARRGYVLEDELDSSAGFRNVIEETRFRAETLLAKARRRVPVTVLRPGIIVGDSQTGEIDRLEGPYLLILLMLNAPADLRVPLPGRGDVPLHLVPVDWVVETGCRIARDPRSVGKTFHLVDPHPLTAQAVFESIAREVGRPMPRGSVPARLASVLLRTPGLGRLAHLPRAFLEQLATEVVYDARNTMELLGESIPPCPPFERYVGAMVEAVRRREAQRRARGGLGSDVDMVGGEDEDPLSG